MGYLDKDAKQETFKLTKEKQMIGLEGVAENRQVKWLSIITLDVPCTVRLESNTIKKWRQQTWVD